MSRTVEWPIAVRSVDIAQPLAPLHGLERYSRVRVFVIRGDVLLGSVDIWNRGAATISVTRLIDEIAARHGETLFDHEFQLDTLQQGGAVLLPDGTTARLPSTTVSIVVPTCGRPDELRRCLESLVAQRTRHAIEIVVVENRPSAPTAAAVAARFPSVHLVVEPRPGLSFARNAGIVHASGAIIVATDDDVVAPPNWIETLVAPFARADVMAVTGHVLPLELETEAQCRFEAYGGLGKGFAPFEAGPRWFRATRAAVPTWKLGATANAAFRAGIFADLRIGLLDEALGAGMPTGCSEDTYLFYRVLKSGHTIVYNPSAYVWHRHRPSMTSLRRQIYDYSKGHVAYQLTTWLKDYDRRAFSRLFYALPRTYLGRAWQRLRRHSDYPLGLILLEIAGNLAGPWALWRARRRVRRLGPGERTTAEHRHAVSLESQAT